MSHDFVRVLRENGVGHVRIHPHTPEQNGFVERVIRTIGEGLHEDELDTFAQAEQALDEIIDWYNHRRLHSGIDYLTPALAMTGPQIASWRSAAPSWPLPAIGGEKKI